MFLMSLAYPKKSGIVLIEVAHDAASTVHAAALSSLQC
jgi:hypothetical protein